jgi:hypothetical protein
MLLNLPAILRLSNAYCNPELPTTLMLPVPSPVFGLFCRKPKIKWSMWNTPPTCRQSSLPKINKYGWFTSHFGVINSIMKTCLICLFTISVLFLKSTHAAGDKSGILPVNSGTAATANSGTTAPAAGGSLVKGSCTIELKIGTHQYLSKMGIAVVPASLEKELTQVRNDQWRMRASRAQYNDGLHNLDLDAIGGLAVKNAVQTVQTDAAGKYQIRGLAPGSYLLYSQYHSRYAVAYWLVPLTVKSDKDEITVDINNSNMKEVYNIKKEQW